MRQFLNTLFVLNESAYLSLDGENVVVSCDKAEVGRVALHTLESILCFSYAGASPALMGKCGRLGIDLCFFSPQGRFLARTVGEERGNVLLRQTQYEVSASEARSCTYARNFILPFITEGKTAEEDYKTQLQEVVQQDPSAVLRYEVTGESGPDHAKKFTVCVWRNCEKLAEAPGRSKKAAEQHAAKLALEKLR